MRPIVWDEDQKRMVFALAVIACAIVVITGYVALTGHVVFVKEIEEPVEETIILEPPEQNITPVEENITPPEPSPLQKVKTYLEEHPQADFGEQSDSMEDVDIRGGVVYLDFIKGQAAADFEAWYLCGVLFVVFDEYDKVEVRGYDSSRILIPNAHKYPDRANYKFYPKHFPGIVQEEKTECVSDLDCNDSNACTNDMCYQGKCSNAFVVRAGCVR